MFDSIALAVGLEQQRAIINSDAFTLEPIPGAGIGAVAKRDLPKNTSLFHIPFSLLLTPYTSDLRPHLSESEWATLGTGWAPLILSMMWETEQGSRSRWAAYLQNMPTTFSTPIFWSAAESDELVGTDIESRIGKAEAEQEYQARIMPLLRSRRDLFPPGSPNFNLAAFHMQGSRILSRSFTIPLRHAGRVLDHPTRGDSEDDDGDDDDDEVTVAAMIPMADMLNAANDRDNARLFSDNKGYAMRTSREIRAGDQILNTYDSPPNSELLRKYGHVDVFPLIPDQLALLEGPELAQWCMGNPSDEVDIEGSLIVESVTQVLERIGDESWQATLRERVDLWLDAGHDDSFPATLSPHIDDQMISFTRVLLHDSDWRRFRNKGKIPEAVVDTQVATVLSTVVAKRMSRYRTTLEDGLDQLALSADVEAGPARLAAIVRVGEQRILRCLDRLVRKSIPAAESVSPQGKRGRKHDGPDEKIAKVSRR